MRSRSRPFKLAETWRGLPWQKVSWALHGVWFFGLLMVWNNLGEPKLDAISLSISVLQTFLAVVAVGGFWLLRQEVRSKALEEMERIGEKLAYEELYPRVLRHALDPQKPFEPLRESSVEDSQAYARAFGEAEDER